MALAQLADEKLKSEGKVLPATISQGLGDLLPELADVHVSPDFPGEGLRLNSGVKTDLRFAADFSGPSGRHPESTGILKLIFSDLTFGTEALSAHSECLQDLEPEPAVFMHTREAQGLNLVDGDTISIRTESGRFEAKLKVLENMAAGVLVIPRHRKLSWQIFDTGMSGIGRDQITKVTA